MRATPRTERLALAIGALGLVVVTAAFAAGGAVPVRLKLTGGASDLEVGQAARLTASAKLPKAGRLLIQALRPGGRVVRVASCPRSPCSGRYRGTSEGTVRFQASAIMRVEGKTRTLGRSPRVAVFWSRPVAPVPPEPPEPPPAPEPPPPAATPGHYAGKTADNELWEFDVDADGLWLTNLRTGQINQHCEPPAYLSRGEMEFPGPLPIGRDGSFAITETLDGTVDDDPSTVVVAITGRVAGGSASGTYRVGTSFSYNGQVYSCTTGDQSWSASKA